MNNNIIERLERIETKLDEVIAAMHAYDDTNIEDVNEGYGESSFEAFKFTNEYISSFDVDGAERRTHHVTNEEADDDARSNNIQTKRVGKDKGNNNNPANKRGGKKSSVGEHIKYPPHKH